MIRKKIFYLDIWQGKAMKEIYLAFEHFNQWISGIIWGPVMIFVMLAIGIYFTWKTGFFQFTKIRLWFGKTILEAVRPKKSGKRNHITPFQALSTALAGTMGTGNIVGVATAITLGGPGAIFWMWISAFLGMMTKYAETVLAVKYRRKNEKGQWIGGAMEYLEHGLHKKWLASAFCVFCVFASLGMGNMTQANSIAGALNSSFGIDPLLTGIILALLTALVIFGGLQRIAKVSEALIPFLSIAYLIGGVIIILCHSQKVPACFSAIFQDAFSFQSTAGGVGGYMIVHAMRYGVGRGIFSNEAGLGSSGMVYAASDSDEPAEAGMWGIFEVFADTIVVCTITALAILTSGVAAGGKEGAALSSAAFGTVFGPFGEFFVSVSIALFAFASMIGWAYYGERGLEYLVGERLTGVYKLIFISMTVVGCIARLELVWNLSETFNGLMALPNLYGVTMLSGTVIAVTRDYLGRQRKQRINKKAGAKKKPEVYGGFSAKSSGKY